MAIIAPKINRADTSGLRQAGPSKYAALADGLTNGIRTGLAIKNQQNQDKMTKLNEEKFEKEKRDNELIMGILKEGDTAKDKLLQGAGGSKGLALGRQMQQADIAKRRIDIAEEELGLSKDRAKALKNSPLGQRYSMMNAGQQDSALAHNKEVQVMMGATTTEIESAQRRDKARLSSKQRTLRINAVAQPNGNDLSSVDSIMRNFTVKDGEDARAIFSTSDVDFDTDAMANDIAGISKGVVAAKSANGIKTDPVSTSKGILEYLRPAIVKKDPTIPATRFSPEIIMGADYEIDIEQYDRRLELLGKTPQEIINLTKIGTISEDEAVELLDIIGNY